MTKQETSLINSKKGNKDFQDIAKNTGLSEPTVKKFFAGDTGISLKNSYIICKEIGVRIRLVEEDFKDQDYVHKSRLEDVRAELIKEANGKNRVLALVAFEKVELLNSLLNG